MFCRSGIVTGACFNACARSTFSCRFPRLGYNQEIPMLCQKCQQREATVHYAKIDGDKVTKVDFCEECAGRELPPPQRPCDIEVYASPVGMLQIHRGPTKNLILCQKCHEREATVHVCKIDGDTVTKGDFCEECATEPTLKGIELENLTDMLASGQPHAPTRDEILQCFAGRTVRYPIDAYEFVCWALENCLKGTHVLARELLEAIRELALKEFGKRAKTALAQWKVFRTEDIGEIVFEMIDAGALCKQPEDSKEDFQNGFNFDEVFPES